MDQITIAGDGAGDLLAPASRAIEGLLDGLHGEVGVATVYYLEDFEYLLFRDRNRLYLKFNAI